MQHMWRAQTRPVVLGVLWGWIALMIAVIVLTCAGCMRPMQPGWYHSRSSNEERLRYAVEIHAFCIQSDPLAAGPTTITMGSGSGVLLDSTHILTAWHVAGCGFLGSLDVQLSDGSKWRAVVDKEWPDHDLSRLRILGQPLLPVPTVHVIPAYGVVCSAFASPTRGTACGVVIGMHKLECPKHEWCHDTTLRIAVAPGNSGGGLYSESGELVGIITGGAFDALGKPLGFGMAVQLYGMRSDVMSWK